MKIVISFFDEVKGNVTCTTSYKHAHNYVHTLTVAPCGTPKWLTVRCSLPTSVWISWGAVPKDQRNGKITGYSMHVEGPDFTLNFTIIEDNYFYMYKEVSDLRPSTEYSFSVSAMTVAGSGPAISVSFVTPQEGEASIL